MGPWSQAKQQEELADIKAMLVQLGAKIPQRENPQLTAQMTSLHNARAATVKRGAAKANNKALTLEASVIEEDELDLDKAEADLEE